VRLRPYQIEAVNKVRAEFRDGAAGVLLQMPTGAGKTIVASGIVGSAYERGTRTLFLVHRAELLRQTTEKFTAFRIPHATLAAGMRRVPGDQIVVASVQTAARRIERMPPFDFIVIDEAHHALAQTWREILDANPRARLLGLSATPSRLDGRGLGEHVGGYFDRMVVGPSVQQLIDDGALAPPRVFASAQRVDVSRVRSRGGEFATDQLAAVMSERRLIGDAIDHYSRICPGKRAIAFCVNIAHAEDITAAFRAAGWPAARIDGGMGPDERARLVAAFSSGTVKILVSVDLISEGFDVPGCDAALLLRPTHSEGLFLQQVGRALRPAPGKACAYILDHAENTERHGLPQEDRVWSLDGRRPRDGGPDVKRCPSCFAMLPRMMMQCPECEHTFALSTDDEGNAGRGGGVEQVEGELIELTPAMIEERRRSRNAEVARAETRADLERIARERGYRRGWVDHVLRARGMR
jgi:DNA repair protein RadD